MECPIIVRSHSSSWDHSSPTHASSPHATPRTNHATKPYLFCGTLGSPYLFFSRIIMYRHTRLSAYCTKSPPFYNFRKRSKKDKALRHNCRPYCDKCISVQRFLCFRFTGNAITLITYVYGCRQHLRYKTQPYP